MYRASIWIVAMLLSPVFAGESFAQQAQMSFFVTSAGPGKGLHPRRRWTNSR
jgi:hypothetical protein